MKQKWGREEYAGDWPSGKAVWTIGAVFVARGSRSDLSLSLRAILDATGAWAGLG